VPYSCPNVRPVVASVPYSCPNVRPVVAPAGGSGRTQGDPLAAMPTFWVVDAGAAPGTDPKKAASP
jgi:hypothetical protein